MYRCSPTTIYHYPLCHLIASTPEIPRYPHITNLLRHLITMSQSTLKVNLYKSLPLSRYIFISPPIFMQMNYTMSSKTNSNTVPIKSTVKSANEKLRRLYILIIITYIFLLIPLYCSELAVREEHNCSSNRLNPQGLYL